MSEHTKGLLLFLGCLSPFMAYYFDVEGYTQDAFLHAFVSAALLIIAFSVFLLLFGNILFGLCEALFYVGFDIYRLLRWLTRLCLRCMSFKRQP